MPGIVVVHGSENATIEVASILRRLARYDRIQSTSATITADHSVAILGVATQMQRTPIAKLENGSLCVLQGYLTNGPVLRKTLSLPEGTPDSAIMLKGFEKFGEGVFQKADGSFNCYIHDARLDTSYLAGDCYGHLPTYVHIDSSGRVIIAPELKAFTQVPWFKADVDWNSISDFLVLAQPWGGKTLLKNVFNLEPGTFIRWRNGTSTIHSYWRIPYQKKVSREITSAAFAEELNSCLEHCVGKLTSLKGSKALFLSGGFDSRIIACYMRRMVGDKFDTLGMQFNGSPASDSRVSSRIAQALGVSWKTIDYTVHDAERFLEEHLDIHDGTWPCSYFPQALPVRDLCSQYDFVVNGNNGNHIFGDYATNFLKHQLDLLSTGFSSSWFLQERGDGVYRSLTFHLASQARNYSLPMLSNDFAQQALTQALASFDTAYFARSDIIGADKYEYLAITQTGRRYGLFNTPLQDFFEGLNPLYHCRELLTLMSSVPLELKFSRTWDSELLATQFPEVFLLPKLSGYPSYLRYQEQVAPEGRSVDDYYDGKWIYKNLLSNRTDQVVNDPRFLRREWINHDHIKNIWQHHKNGTGDATAPLATIIAIDHFLRAFTHSD